jgi:hypothetical protein
MWGRVEDGQAEPFVDAAFALVAGHADAADLARTRHVRPAVGLDRVPWNSMLNAAASRSGSEHRSSLNSK